MDRESKRVTRANNQAPDEAEAELVGALRERLNQLPSLERQLLGLHFSGGLTQQEIGEALAIPQQTVSYKITEALKRLRTSLSGAGFAAAVPLVDGSGLSEAICSGHAVPAALQAKVMAAVSGTKAAAASAVRQSLRAKKAATAGSKAGVWLATVTVVAAAAGAVYVATRNTTPPPAPAPAPVVVPAPAQAPLDPAQTPIKQAAPDFIANWSFPNGKRADLFTALGDWTWNEKEKAMAAPKYMKVIFPLSFPANPVKIITRGKIINVAEEGTYGFMLMSNGPIVQPRTWKRSIKAATGNIEYTTYLFDPYLVEYFGETISRVVEFEKPHADAVPVLSIQNLYITEIEMRGIKFEDVPAAIREPLKLTEGMNMMRPEDDPGLKKKPPTGE